jgi:hypothetical protein
MVISHPLFPTDVWTLGRSGWIHTSYDNSTSTETLNWVQPSRLEEQVGVVALSVVRISSSSSEPVGTSPFPWLTIGIGIAVAGVVVAVTILYLVIMRKPRRKEALPELGQAGRV